MKKIQFVMCVALSFLLAAGCEKIIEFEGEEKQPRLTISSQVEAGEPLEVYVASSIFFLADATEQTSFIKNLDVNRGQVRCYVNGSQEAMVLTPKPDDYLQALLYVAGDYVPAPGDRIRIEVEFPNFDSVWAETVVPRTPAFELISAQWRKMDSEEDWEWSVEDESYYEVELTLAVTDDASYDKYYFVQPVIQFRVPYLEETIVTQRCDFSSNDVLFREMGGSNAVMMLDGEAGNYFSDGLIKGQRREFTITVSMLPEKEEDTRLWVHGAAVNESLYWYDYSYTQLINNMGLFSEGVTLYSNVHGGYGFLGAAASKWLEVEW